MLGRIIASVMLLALVAGMASIANAAPAVERVDIIFDMRADNSVKQTNIYVFNATLSGPVNYSVGSAIRDIVVSDGKQELSYNMTPSGSGYMLEIQLKNETQSLLINYVVNNIILESDSVHHFYTELKFDGPVNSLSIQAKIPQGFEIYQNTYFPADATIGSDGSRIILLWSQKNATSSFISLKFSPMSNDNSVFIVIIIILLAILSFSYLYYRERRKELIMTGFREDEKKVIEYIEHKKIALQSDLEKEFHFSRAKSTRIVARLAEKGFIEKKKFGRTNKLKWKK